MTNPESIRHRLRRLVETVETPGGWWFDAAVMLLIMLSMLVAAAETLPQLEPWHITLLEWTSRALLLLFTGEYLLRLWVAKQPARYAISFFGIVDLMSILPQLLMLGGASGSLRSLRLLRLFRLLKLARYNRALRRLHLALKLAWEELVLFVAVSSVLLYLAAVGIYYFENEAQPEAFASVFHSLWWSVVTLTTVGYGDTVPITAGGRGFTFLVLLIGLGVVAMPAGLIASALTEARSLEELQSEQSDRNGRQETC